MKKIILVLLVLLYSSNLGYASRYKLKATNYYSLAGDLETKITKWDGKHLNLKIYEVDKKSNYPVGAEFMGIVTEQVKARRFNRDEYLMVHVSNVLYPDGSLRAEDLKFKLHARGILNTERMATTAVGVTALTLGTIFDATVVGLPISRGGYGIWYSAAEIRNRTEDSSRLKAGLIGFTKGIFFPIPQLVGRGRSLNNMLIGARVSLDEESKGKSIDAYLRA